MKNKYLMSCFFRSILLIGLLLGTTNFVNSQNIDVELSKNKVVVGGQTYILHLVKEKQTLFSISKAYNVELSELMKINHKSEPSVKVGEVLRIPDNASKSAVAPLLVKKQDDKFYYHVVKRGDTLFSLYKKYGVDVASIKKVNPEISNSLAIGTVIKIPKQSQNLQKKKEQAVQTVPKHDKKYFYYVIKEGDTEYSISRQFFMKLRKFRKLNPKVKKKPLKIGDWVRIPRYLVPPEYFVVEETPKDTITEEVVTADTIVEDLVTDKVMQNKIRIGLFLPLYLEANDTINQIITYKDTFEIVTEREPKVIYSKSRNFIRFYQGVLMAVDSLQEEGLSIDLHVFDTERNPKKLHQTISRIQFTDFDFFIGPVFQNTFSVVADFARRRRIPIVSPLSAKNGELKTNPFVIQVNTSIESICGKLSDYVCTDFEMKNLVVVHPERYKHFNEYKLVTDIERNLFEKGEYWKNDQISYKKISFDEYGLYGIERVLSDTCENIILLPINNQPIVENIITNLNVLSQRFAIRLIGFSKWQRYNSLESEVLYNLNFSVMSPYYIDYKDEKVAAFVTDFRNRFLAEPNDYSFSGFDLCRYFSLAVSKFGDEFTERMNEMDIDLLQSSYHFNRVNTFGGLENLGVHFINYSRDFKIRHHVPEPEYEMEEENLLIRSFEY